MDTQKINLLMKSLGRQIITDGNAGEVLSVLVKETLRFRNKLEEETGVIFTIEDTSAALNAFELYLRGEEWGSGLSEEQSALLQIWIDRITIFEK
jgi:hypothetical protein